MAYRTPFPFPRPKERKMRPPARSSRTVNEKKREPSGVYFALQEFTDAIEALPLEVVRHFTLLREFDAKCQALQTDITEQIESLLQRDTNKAIEKGDGKRGAEMVSVKDKISQVLPCFEEKIHVCNRAGDAIGKHMQRLEDCFLHIQDEIPAVVCLGPKNHPAFITQIPITRSETRREAVAARRADRDPQGAQGTNSSQQPQPTPKRRRVDNDRPAPPSGRNLSITGGSVRGMPGAFGVGDPTNGGTRRRQRRMDPHSEEDRSDDNRDEEIFCICRSVSYGEMVACDGENCKYEWFHLPCVQLDAPPKGSLSLVVFTNSQVAGTAQTVLRSSVATRGGRGHECTYKRWIVCHMSDTFLRSGWSHENTKAEPMKAEKILVPYRLGEKCPLVNWRVTPWKRRAPKPIHPRPIPMKSFGCTFDGTEICFPSTVLLKAGSVVCMVSIRCRTLSNATPNAAMPSPVRIHARNVRSLARWSRAVDPSFFHTGGLQRRSMLFWTPDS